MIVAASRRAPGPVQPRRSGEGIVYSDVDVNKWAETVPGVDRVRPGCCSRCGAASRVPGVALGLVGHGKRTRQVRGPSGPSEPPRIIVIDARRYRCRHCGGITTVLPRGLHARRHYSGSAIGLALCWFGIHRLTVAETRRRVCAWSAGFEPQSWSTLYGWLDAVAEGRLFARVRSSPPSFSYRQRAERAAAALVAMAPVTLAHHPPEDQVFAGAALAA